ATVVGSIGVIFQTFEVSDTLSRWGVKTAAITSGPFKDIGSPFKPLAAEDRALLQEMVDEYYAQFVGVVRQARPGLNEANAAIATSGRVFSGTQAQALGLIDGLGQLPDALERARTLSEAPEARVVMYRRPYGYGGSIYATSQTAPPADEKTLRVEWPAA